MLHPNYLDRARQETLLAAIQAVIVQAPLYVPRVPSGKPMSVRMTNCGPLGWITDARGYRYEPLHPLTGRPWPPMPALLGELWRELCDPATHPDACLVNRYDADARMGLHRDSDEADFSFPVLSVSLGDTALFRLGGLSRADPSGQIRLASGDVVILAGEARRAYHGVDRILAGSSQIVPGGGRLNLTLRRARPAGL